MDDLDKELLNEIQWTFPLVTRPFDAIAKKFDTTSEIVKERLNNLKEIGVLRQLSAIFDTRKLGYTSSLVAMEIEHDQLESVANQINRHPGVSHNYEREHQFNLWFTLAVPPGSDLKTEIEKILRASKGVEFKMIVGQVMRTLKGRAEGKKIMELLKELHS